MSNDNAVTNNGGSCSMDVDWDEFQHMFDEIENRNTLTPPVVTNNVEEEGGINCDSMDVDSSTGSYKNDNEEITSNEKEFTSIEQTITENFNSLAILDNMSVCASCGKEGNSDDMNTCNKCQLVKYCNAACKKKHRTKHKKKCDRLVAELHDEKLFEQPTPEEDCPICMTRLPSLISGKTYMACCGKVICNGCFNDFQSRITCKKDYVCPFCRTLVPESVEETFNRYKKRMELNDPIAIHQLGLFYFAGLNGYPQDQTKALELWHQAAELGNSLAYHMIGRFYWEGVGVEKDGKRAVYYFELAAIGGDAGARWYLGVIEAKAGNMDRSLKHFMIAVKDGSLESLTNIKVMYKNGDATKDEYAKALLSYQSYLDEIRSEQRDEAAAFTEEYRYYESDF